tara:strand:+ start:3175 stop:3300 length:126 start_codon:yes stop_codon:yes gene_type:complete
MENDKMLGKIVGKVVITTIAIGTGAWMLGLYLGLEDRDGLE